MPIIGFKIMDFIHHHRIKLFIASMSLVLVLAYVHQEEGVVAYGLGGMVGMMVLKNRSSLIRRLDPLF